MVSGTRCRGRGWVRRLGEWCQTPGIGRRVVIVRSGRRRSIAATGGGAVKGRLCRTLVLIVAALRPARPKLLPLAPEGASGNGHQLDDLDVDRLRALLALTRLVRHLRVLGEGV